MYKFYKNHISPVLKYLFAGNCRYLPTCSDYSHQAFKKYGVARGLLLSSKRVLKCNPLSNGGYDPLI